MLQPSFEAVSDIVGELYEAACGEKDWSGVIANIRHLFNASNVCLVRQGPELSNSDYYRSEFDPVYVKRYIEEFSENELADALSILPIGVVYSDQTLLGEGRLRQTRLWNEWMAPQDMYSGLACKVMAAGSSFWFFDVQRGKHQPAFDTDEFALMERLAPHFLRAVKMARTTHIAGAVSNVFSHLPFGLVIVDAAMRVIRANPASEEMLDQPSSALRFKSGCLYAANAVDRTHLQALVAGACAPSQFGLPGTGGDYLVKGRTEDGAATDLVVTVAPLTNSSSADLALEAFAAVYIRQLTLDLPERFEDYMRLAYRLSPKEARIASRLASGLSLKEAAGIEGIAFSTARTYMEHLFHKTGTHQQSALVALLKSLHPLRHGG